MSSKPNVSIRVLPAGAGLAWLAGSLALVRAQPWRLLLLTVLMQAVLSLSQVPLLGLLVVLAMPAFSAGLLQGFHMVSAGQRPPLAVLFTPLTSRPRTGRLLALGAVMFAAGILSASLLMGGAFGEGAGGLDPDLISRIEQGDTEALTQIDPEFIFRMAAALATAVAVTGTLSYLTIPLIWFSELPVGTALLAGLRAMVVNWKPFLVLALGMAAALVPVALVLGMLFGGGGASPGGSVLGLVLVIGVMLFVQLMIFGTQYCAHRAIFGLSDAGGSSTGAPDDNVNNGDDDRGDRPEGGDGGQFVA
ncbi:BPSS1780 family membrane protein [Elongatibacter sediminis]|uniref:BPSS1780 family membrane protein n=1 Tax=Elongatibacter sediminis TaxID=3119006 RepID=A0AAW9RJX1_9GAMM